MSPSRKSNMSKPPKGWFMSGDTPDCYEASVETCDPHSGTKCAHVHSVAVRRSCTWATLMQQMSPGGYVNNRIRMTLWVKTREVEGYVQPWMRIDGRRDECLSFDNMCNRYIRGTTDWSEHQLVLDVPPESTNIAFGVIIGGKGHVWFDDVSFDIVGDEVAVTDCPCSNNSRHAKKPQNLNFEESD